MTPPFFQKTERRIEVKDVFSTLDLGKIERAIRLSKFAFYQPYPKRKVNSIYFDDFSFSSLEESINGNSTRTKKRIRWYGNKKQEVNAVLELKKKRGIYSWKHLSKNVFRVDPSSRKWSGFLISDDIAKDRILIGDNYIPQSIVSYKRDYYTSFDGTVRITVDQNLQTYQQDKFSTPNLNFSTNHNPLVILEIKVGMQNFHLLKEVVKQIPFSPKRFSKYCKSLLPQRPFLLPVNADG